LAYFLGNAKEMYEAATEEMSEIEHFIGIWWKRYKSEKVTASMLSDLARSSQAMMSTWGNNYGGGIEDTRSNILMGKKLSYCKGRLFGKYIIHKGKSGGAIQYHLEELATSSSENKELDFTYLNED
jgi:hypothetical protein